MAAPLNILKKSLLGQLLLTSTMVTSGAIINFVQLMLNILVKPFNRKIFNNLMYYVNYVWLSHAAFILDHWSNSEIILHCRREVFEQFGKKHHLILLNHSYEIDWLITFGLLDKFYLLGFVKAFAKNAIKFIPFFGWFFGLSEQIFLQRSFEKDRKVIDDAMSSFLRYPRSVCIMMPAEGTRFTREKHEASMEFAKKSNLPLLKHHLIPRSRGFISCVPTLKENSEIISVLNMQIVFDPKATIEPKLINIIRGESVTAHVYLDIVPMHKIEATNESLIQIYQEKDELHDSFLKFGNFYEGRGTEPIEGIKLKPQQNTLILFIFWLMVNVFVMIYFTMLMVQNGYLISLVMIFLGLTAMVYGVMKLCVLYSVTKKGSQYGKKEK